MPTAQEFQNYCNSLGSGYLKTNKATNMMIALRDIPDIVEDDIRLFAYITNCLVMEGFRDGDIATIVDYITANA